MQHVIRALERLMTNGPRIVAGLRAGGYATLAHAVEQDIKTLTDGEWVLRGPPAQYQYPEKAFAQVHCTVCGQEIEVPRWQFALVERGGRDMVFECDDCRGKTEKEQHDDTD